jgi:hypothetical protein
MVKRKKGEAVVDDALDTSVEFGAVGGVVSQLIQEATGAPESGRVDDALVLFMRWSVSGQVSQEMSRSKIVLSARVRASDALFLKLTSRWRCAIR